MFRGLTCVHCAGVEQCVCVGDKLQLSVQVQQDAAGQRHVHLTVTFDFHSIYLCCHIQRSQRGSDVYLQQDVQEKVRWWKDNRYVKYVKDAILKYSLNNGLWEGLVRPSLKM